MELKYKYLYDNNNNLVYVENAEKGDYRLKPNLPLDYILVESYNRNNGIIVSKHFKLKSDNIFCNVGNTLAENESIEHYNYKMKIVYEKKYYDNIFGQEIFFDDVICEEKQGEKRPDLSCYMNGELVCCIELFYTNKKKELDILELQNIGVPVIEINIKNEQVKHIILPKILESNKREFGELQIEYSELKGIDRDTEEIYISTEQKMYREYSNSETIRLNKIYHWIQDRETKYKFRIYKVNSWLQNRIKSTESKIRETEHNIESIEGEINFAESEFRNYKNGISKIRNIIEKTDYRTGKNEHENERINSEIKTIENSIKDRRRLFTEITKSCKLEWFRPNYITKICTSIENEIKYWLS